VMRVKVDVERGDDRLEVGVLQLREPFLPVPGSRGRYTSVKVPTASASRSSTAPDQLSRIRSRIASERLRTPSACSAGRLREKPFVERDPEPCYACQAGLPPSRSLPKCRDIVSPG